MAVTIRLLLVRLHRRQPPQPRRRRQARRLQPRQARQPRRVRVPARLFNYEP